jgi:transposase-like protein
MLDVRIKVRLLLLQARCPSCSSSNLRPGYIRSWVEGPLFRTWLFVSLRRPFLCRDCDERFYDFRFKARNLSADEEEITTMLEHYVPPALPELDAPAALGSEEISAGKQDRTA